jgi:nitrite reductase (NADH) small subunit
MARPGLALAIAAQCRGIDFGHVDHLPAGRSRVVQVRGERLALHRTRRGDVYASQASCPCAGESLDGALIGGRLVVCPGHGLAFNLATGQCVGGTVDELRTYAASIDEDGHVVVEVQSAR